jgi:hypothetical protein
MTPEDSAQALRAILVGDMTREEMAAAAGISLDEVMPGLLRLDALQEVRWGANRTWGRVNPDCDWRVPVDDWNNVRGNADTTA